MVLIAYLRSDVNGNSIYGFRPLTGIMVLIRTLYNWLHKATQMAFYGADRKISIFYDFC